MSLSLDFSRFSTWENVDFVTACLRMSCNEEDKNSYNLGALKVSATLFKKIENKNERAQFFSKCENLGLRSWKLAFAFKNLCHSNYEYLFRSVLKSDEAMLKALKEKEIQMQKA